MVQRQVADAPCDMHVQVERANRDTAGEAGSENGRKQMESD